MSPDVHILLSGALSFGVPLAFAIRELIVLGRGPGDTGRDGDVPRDRRPSPTPDDEPTLPPLPLGLVLALQGNPDAGRVPRVRVLEDA